MSPPRRARLLFIAEVVSSELALCIEPVPGLLAADERMKYPVNSKNRERRDGSSYYSSGRALSGHDALVENEENKCREGVKQDEADE